MTPPRQVLWVRYEKFEETHIPIPSMFGILTYILLICMVNVDRYTIYMGAIGYVYLEPVSLSSTLRVVCFTLHMKAQTPSIQNKGRSCEIIALFVIRKNIGRLT